MIFDKYIDNPSGGAVFANRQMFKQMYQSKFDKVLLKENGKIEYHLFKTDDKFDTHYIYFKIPSEVIDNFYYDVIIQLYTKDNKMKNNANLRSYEVKFYSNDPSFVYTFAHSFKKNDLFIKDLEPKMSKKALNNVAKQKNPKDEVWYVKSLYFAYLAMERYHLFHRVSFAGAEKYNKTNLLSKITNADTKVADRQRAQEKLIKEKKKEKENTSKLTRPPMAQDKITKTTKVAVVAKVGDSIKRAKKTKIIGKK